MVKPYKYLNIDMKKYINFTLKVLFLAGFIICLYSAFLTVMAQESSVKELVSDMRTVGYEYHYNNNVVTCVEGFTNGSGTVINPIIADNIPVMKSENKDVVWYSINLGTHTLNFTILKSTGTYSATYYENTVEDVPRHVLENENDY